MFILAILIDGVEAFAAKFAVELLCVFTAVIFIEELEYTPAVCVTLLEAAIQICLVVSPSSVVKALDAVNATPPRDDPPLTREPTPIPNALLPDVTVIVRPSKVHTDDGHSHTALPEVKSPTIVDTFDTSASTS
jgi:hypothetical protein